MTLVAKLFFVVLCIAACWISLSGLLLYSIEPRVFVVLFLISLALGFFLIVMQVNSNGGDDGKAITTLSGEVIPAIPESSGQIEEDQRSQLAVNCGKVIFFVLSVFLLVFWTKLSYYGLPKKWADAFSGFISLFAYSLHSYDARSAARDYVGGDYSSAIKHGVNSQYDMQYAYRPYLLGLPYFGFIVWVLKGRRSNHDNDDPD